MPHIRLRQLGKAVEGKIRPLILDTPTPQDAKTILRIKTTFKGHI